VRHANDRNAHRGQKFCRQQRYGGFIAASWRILPIAKHNVPSRWLILPALTGHGGRESCRGNTDFCTQPDRSRRRSASRHESSTELESLPRGSAWARCEVLPRSSRRVCFASCRYFLMWSNRSAPYPRTTRNRDRIRRRLFSSQSFLGSHDGRGHQAHQVPLRSPRSSTTFIGVKACAIYAQKTCSATALWTRGFPCITHTIRRWGLGQFQGQSLPRLVQVSAIIDIHGDQECHPGVF